jgi:hypothetical protein
MPRTAKAKPPAKPVDDFTADDPPPRTRPIGEPVSSWVVLPPGESPAAVYWNWDKKGRIPEGSILCEFEGTALDPKRSGFRVAAVPAQGSDSTRHALGKVGDAVPAGRLSDRFGVVDVVSMTGRKNGGWKRFVVFAPMGGGYPADSRADKAERP